MAQPNQTDRHKHTDAHPAELTPTEARQASNRTMTFRVLIFGTALVVLAGLALGAYYYLPAANRPGIEGSPPRQ